MTGTNDANQQSTLDQAVQQFVDARLRGQQPDLDEFVKQYPELEHQIREKIRNLRKIDTLFDSLAQADESDFEGISAEQDLSGQKIGSFEITEMIGRGGMGVVYLAHDTKLERSVAIKSMPVEIVGDSTARIRFTREAKLLASLSHPNIGVIHDIIEQAEGSAYLVLEYVPGETLAKRIAKGPFKLQEALTFALQIAEAVAAAHEHDVIHRDLKPGNIKITPDGRVKVLDFGLAKALSGESSEKSSTVTQPGRIMGTPAYMSPEQARGQPTDKRSDIWSFGCVLYEMLTGKVPFEGETISDTVANILQTEPDWQVLPQSTPANILVLLRRCLEKDPRRRLQHIGDASIEVDETLRSTAEPITTVSSILGKSEMARKAKLRNMAMVIGATIVIVLTVIVVRFIQKEPTLPASTEIRLVVLPFENLGPPEDEYFADGITDAITARLVGIQGLGVISRQSAMQYKKRERNTRQIAQELGADYILEGTVQRERSSDLTSQVRIIPQLIKASDDTHVWAETYDNDMSEVFRVQSDLAERVAQALDITLLEPERRALKTKPTENMEAYDYYLRGNEYFHRSFEESDFSIAIRMYDSAIELDARFTLAYAQLSRSHLYIYLLYDQTEERLAMAKDALDKVLELAPDLLETHLALGHYYYHGHMDHDRALEQFEIARKRQPNNSELMTFIGYVQRRQGKFEQAVVTLKRASELDPRSARLTFNIGETFMLLRKYSQAEHYYERAISLAPDLARPYTWKVLLYLLWDGKTEKARTVLEDASRNIGSSEYDEREIVPWSVLLDVFDENYQEALAQLSSCKLEAFYTQFYFIPKAQLYAHIYGLMGNRQLEQAYYESSRSVLETKVREQPEDARFHSSLGIAYAGLGRKEEAIREGLLAVELLPVTKDAWRGLYRVKDLARIYVMVGEFDAAIDQLEFLLTVPAEVSIPLLQLDPTWSPLRNHPRFQKLLKSGK